MIGGSYRQSMTVVDSGFHKLLSQSWQRVAVNSDHMYVIPQQHCQGPVKGTVDDALYMLSLSVIVEISIEGIVENTLVEQYNRTILYPFLKFSSIKI